MPTPTTNTMNPIARAVNANLTAIGDSNDRPAWLAARRNIIGSSEVPALLGLSRFSTPAKLLAVKLGLVNEDAKISDAALWGNRLERFILDDFRTETERHVEHNTVTFRANGLAVPLASTPDGFQAGEGLNGSGTCQVKVTWRSERWRDDVPADVWAQCQYEMYTVNMDWSSAMYLRPGGSVYWKDLPYDDGFINQTMPLVETFWECVRGFKTLPQSMIDGKPMTTKALDLLFPEAPESRIELDGEWLDMRWEIESLKEQIDKLTTLRNELRNKVRAKMATATIGAMSDGSEFTLKTTTRGDRQLRIRKGKNNA